MTNDYIVNKNTIKNSSRLKKHIYIKYGILSFIIIILIILFILLLINHSYNKAIKNYNKEKYKEAYIFLSKYPNYKNSSKYLREISYNKLTEYKVGDTLFFGEYKNKAISWKILEIKDEKYLLITNGNINFENEYINWKESNIRYILNNNFYYHAFNEKEKEIIMTYYIKDDDTIDKIFILNEDDAEDKYNIIDKENLLFRDHYSSLINKHKVKPVMWVSKEKINILNLYNNGNIEGLEEKDIYKTEIGMYDYLLKEGEDTIYYWKGIENAYFARVSEKDEKRVVTKENITIEAINDILKKRENTNEK